MPIECAGEGAVAVVASRTDEPEFRAAGGAAVALVVGGVVSPGLRWPPSDGSGSAVDTGWFDALGPYDEVGAFAPVGGADVETTPVGVGFVSPTDASCRLVLAAGGLSVAPVVGWLGAPLAVSGVPDVASVEPDSEVPVPAEPSSVVANATP
ncbi:hypothetical protein [Mycobacterium sp. JS623]|uniref:hypothetical protein n=1 Tax=Mycobacterium sp. JS623 TaxID=212767 RepID=UPI00059CC0E1|nr:hypothetical protein [Mycobacterium sp. JS623]